MLCEVAEDAMSGGPPEAAGRVGLLRRQARSLPRRTPGMATPCGNGADPARSPLEAAALFTFSLSSPSSSCAVCSPWADS